MECHLKMELRTLTRTYFFDNASQRILIEFVSNCCVDLLLQIAQHCFDVFPDRAILIRRFRMESKNLAARNRLVYLTKTDLAGRLCQTRPAKSPRLRGNNPRLTQLPQETANHNRVCINARGDIFRLHILRSSPSRAASECVSPSKIDY